METMNRRTFVRKSGLACAGISPLATRYERLWAQLAGSVVNPQNTPDASNVTPTLGGSACNLPHVNVENHRVMRTIVGLRPYRSSGFVVRSEKVDDKLVIHNYGHGGAGITLSWGTSMLALKLGCPGTRAQLRCWDAALSVWPPRACYRRVVSR